MKVFQTMIFITGNTIVDAVYQNFEISRKKAGILHHLGITKNDYFLATVHRQENVDNKERFQGILRGLQMIKEKLDLQGIFPIHPRAKKQMEVFNIQLNSLRLIEPLDYLSFLQLENNAKLILTDSGGVQEEDCIPSSLRNLKAQY
jgi:UDP-N-acetylglucosamine 2-epimerase (non-hydrolysing)